MIALGLAVLALLSLIGIFATNEDPRQGRDPRDDVSYWAGARFR
jgi:hypothetical protein